MKVSKIQVDDNRRAILAAAGRLFRQRGFDAVSVSEVMTAAGLTHGAFYGYFRSKDELVAAALADLLATRRPPGKWAQSAARYLSPGHRDDSGGGCPVAALASEVGRGSTFVIKLPVASPVQWSRKSSAWACPAADSPSN